MRQFRQLISTDNLENLKFFLLVHVVAAIWTMIFGWIAYDFNWGNPLLISWETPVFVGIVIIFTAIGCVLGMRVVEAHQTVFYLFCGCVVGAILTSVGGVVFYLARYHFAMVLPPAWLASSCVGIAAIGLAFISVLFTKWRHGN